MKKVFSLLSLVLVFTLGAYANNKITITSKGNGDLDKQVIAALKAQAPALAGDAALVKDLVKEVQKAAAKTNASSTSKQPMKITKMVKKNNVIYCVDVIIISYWIHYYDACGNYLGSVLVIEIWYIIYPCGWWVPYDVPYEDHYPGGGGGNPYEHLP
jgi:hypothetical protein